MDLRYPIGAFEFPTSVSSEQRQKLIDQIAEAPERLRTAVKGLDDEQLNTPYRPGGWTVRQVVHHVPDSHLNSYIRFKLAVTENEPEIRTYLEDRWAELDDARNAPIEISLTLLETLHRRWVLFLRSLKQEEYQRTFRHPDWGVITIDKTIALYAWHGRHHVAHITSLRERMEW
jgi:uncharacterized damage-inducible protein DinB